MKQVLESPEHHFLTTLERLKQNPQGWISMHFELSRKLDHDMVITSLPDIPRKLNDAKAAGKTFINELQALGSGHQDGFLYQFADNDILFLARADNETAEKGLRMIYKKMADQLRADFSDFNPVSKNLYILQKLADSKVISAKRIEAYQKMADPHITGSISIRRRRREDPLVMIIEDDRFTASYAASILNKQYDMVHAKTGEEAILLYLENAPDIVFIDIHLPGLNGHQTLNALKKIDPDAFAIMLSVDTERSNVISASSNGAQGFLKKPFSKERLLATVQKSPFIRRLKSSSDSSQTFFN